MFRSIKLIVNSYTQCTKRWAISLAIKSYTDSIKSQILSRKYSRCKRNLNLDEIVNNFKMTPKATAFEQVQAFDKALEILLSLTSRFSNDLERGGQSTRDILLSQMQKPRIPVLDNLLEEKFNFSWDAFIDSASRMDCFDTFKHAIKLFLSLPSRSSEQYQRLISACTDLFQVKLAEKLVNMSSDDLQHRAHPIIRESLINCYAKMRDFPSALTQFQEIRRIFGHTTIQAYNHLLEAYVKTSDLEITNDLHFEAEKNYARNRQPLTEHVFDDYSRSVDVSPALEIYQQILLDGLKPTIRIFTSLLLLAARTKNLRMAEKVLEEMEVFSLKPDQEIISLLSHLYCRLGQPKRAENIIFSNPHVKPSNFALNAILSYYTKAGNPRDASRIFKLFNDTKEGPWFSTFSMMFGMFLDLDRLNEALEILEQMKSAGFKPNLYNCNHLLAYFYRKNQTDKFFELLSHMKESSLSDNPYTSSMTIGMYGRLKNVEMLSRVWGDLKRNTFRKISLAEYSNLLRYFLLFDQELEIADIVSHLKRISIFSADTHYATRNFLYAFTRVGDYESAINCLEKLYKDSSISNIHLYNLVLYGIAVDGAFNYLPRITRLMEGTNCVKSQTTFVFLIYLAGEIGDVEKIKTLWDEYVSSGMKIKSEPLKSLMSAYLKNSKPKSAIETFQQYPDVRTESLYGFYIQSLLEMKKYELVWDIIEEMDSIMIPPSIQTINLLLDHFGSRLDTSSFERSFGLINKYKLKPNKFTYALIVRLKVLQGNFEHALQLACQLESMDRELATMARSYLVKTVLQKSSSVGDDAYNKALLVGGTPESASEFMVWIRYYRRVQDERLEADYINRMRQAGFEPPGDRFTLN